MLMSKLFATTSKQDPAGEEAINAKFLIRAGFIAKQMSGVYTLLPLGLRVVNKINTIIREELDAIGATEVLMPALQPKSLWDITGRWDTANEVMYQFKDNSGKDVGLGWTHEEVITNIAKQFIHSYKDLPKSVYQIQTKFRDEPRAKSGILRGREFMMKDLYSFHADEKDRDEYYDRVSDAYKKIFHRIGLKAIITEASGGAFSKYSHEFQVISSAGEDKIYYCRKDNYARNSELIDELGNKCPTCSETLEVENAIEVGNIFKLGTRFSKDLELGASDEKGKLKLVEMCSYGIGPTRVMGTMVEVSHDDKGIVWNKSISPYDVHVVMIGEIENSVKQSLDKVLADNNIEPLVDDRDDVSSGEKLADADLIGCPWRTVISPKSLDAGGVEIKPRTSSVSKIVPIDKLARELN